MFDFFQKLFKRKPRIEDIIQSDIDLLIENATKTLSGYLEKFRRLETEIENQHQCKILSFKYHNGNLTSPHLASGHEPTEKPHGKCKIISFKYRNLEYQGGVRDGRT